MQVEKRHYIINLLLIIAFYLSFLRLEIFNFRLMTAIILNIFLYNRILSGIKVKFILFISIITDILSTSVIGGLFIHYLVIKNILYFSKNKFKEINLLEKIPIILVSISISIFVEILVKRYLEFYIDYIQYQFIGTLSIITVLILQIRKSL